MKVLLYIFILFFKRLEKLQIWFTLLFCFGFSGANLFLL